MKPHLSSALDDDANSKPKRQKRAKHLLNDIADVDFIDSSDVENHGTGIVVENVVDPETGGIIENMVDLATGEILESFVAPTTGEPISPLNSTKSSFKSRNDSFGDDFVDQVAKITAKICPPEVVEAKLAQARKTEEIQQAQSEALNNLNANTCDLKVAVDQMTGKLDKLADAMTSFIQFQVAQSAAQFQG